MPVHNPPTYREQCTKVVGFDAATCDYLCDGVADEVQINAAIAAVVALGGGCVALQRGTYVLAASIVMDNEVWLHGSGSDTVLQHPAAGGFSMITANSKTGIVISDMYLEGNNKATPAIINFTTVTYSELFNLWVHYSFGIGIYLQSTSAYNLIHDCWVSASVASGIRVNNSSYNKVSGCFFYANNTGGAAGGEVYLSGTSSYCIVANCASRDASNNFIYCAGSYNLLIANTCYGWGKLGVGYAFYVAAVGCSVTGCVAYGPGSSGRYGVYIAAQYASVINCTIHRAIQEAIYIEATSDIILVGNNTYYSGRHGIRVDNSSRCVVDGNYVDSPDSGSTNTYHGIYLNSVVDCVVSSNVVVNTQARNAVDGIRLAGTSTDNVVCLNRVRGYDTGINVSAAGCSRTVIKDNVLLNNTAVFADSGTDTKLASVIVPFVNGTDPQDSGFLVDSTNGGDDFARAFTMLPVEVQQVVRGKVYARSAVAEVHSMEADFTIYGAADNEAYTTHNGSVAGLASTSINFAADDVIYWSLTAAGLLAMLGKDSVQVKVDYAAADGDNCATNAYFRTVEIEYV